MWAVVAVLAVASVPACSSDDDAGRVSAAGSSVPTMGSVQPGGDDTTPPVGDPEGDDPADPDVDSTADATDRDAYVAALVEAMAAEETMFAGPDEGRCLAEAIIDGVGVDAITQAGLTPEQFGGDAGGEALAELVDEQGASAIATAMVGCYDDPVAVFAEAFLDGTSPEVAACLRDELDEDDLIRFFEILLFAEDDDPDAADEVMRLYLDLGDACPGIM